MCSRHLDNQARKGTKKFTKIFRETTAKEEYFIDFPGLLNNKLDPSTPREKLAPGKYRSFH